MMSLLFNLLKAFAVGGAICVIGEFLVLKTSSSALIFSDINILTILYRFILSSLLTVVFLSVLPAIHHQCA